MASKQKVNCIYCGKEYSKSGIRIHQANCSTKQEFKQEVNGKNDLNYQERRVNAPVQTEFKQEKQTELNEVNKKSNITEVNFMAEANKNKAEITPKIEEEFGCPCGSVFNKKFKHCPECGESLTWV